MKRFTDTEKWSLPWFRKASMEAKCLWQYITDRCDKAGVWIADWELASFQIGAKVTEAHLAEMEGAIVIIGAGRARVMDFVEFQYKSLSPNAPPHREIITLIEKHRACKDYTYDAPAGLVAPAKEEEAQLFPNPPAPKVKAPKPPAEPALFTFHCGAVVTQEIYDRLKDANPGVDIDREIPRALDWVKGNGRKTKAVFGFLDKWMERKNPAPAPAKDEAVTTADLLGLGMSKDEIDQMIAKGTCKPWPK